MSATTRTIPPPKSSAAAPASVAAPKPKPKMTDEIRRKLGIPLRPTPSPSRPNSGNPAPVPFQKPKMTDENRRRLDKHNRDAALAAIKKKTKPVRPINSAAAGDPTSLVPVAVSSNLTAGDPQSIQDTIKKMRCTVCQSQGIISKALGTTPSSCNNCGAVAPAVASSAPAAAAAAASSLHPNINNTVAHPGFPPPAPLNASAAAPSQVNLILGRPKGAIRRPPSAAVAPLTAAEAAGRDPRSQRQELLGGRSSRRRHRKTSRRTKNKRSTRRR